MRFTGSALSGRQAKVLYETHSATVQGDTLADKFPAFGVHLYQLE